MPLILSMIAGAIFGAGLAISQMVDPRKVLGFLDIAAIPSGGWDPTLMLVFAGALLPMFVAYRIQSRMAKPLADAQFLIPTRTAIDAPLVLGSAIFGVGWGLAGICPGPAFAALPLAGAGLANLALFIAAILIGMLASRLVIRRGS